MSCIQWDLSACSTAPTLPRLRITASSSRDMQTIKWILGSFALVAVLGGGALAALLGGWFTPKHSLPELAEFLAPHIKVWVPGDYGPYPVMVYVSGCGGLYGPDGNMRAQPIAYRDIALDHGYAVVVVDSHKARGHDHWSSVARICTGYELRAAERAGDIFAALKHVESDSRLDLSDVVLAGWSHGGWTIMEAMTFDLEDSWPHNLEPTPVDEPAQISGLFLVYPYCGFPSRTGNHPWNRSPQVMALLVEDDALAPEQDCMAAFKTLEASGVGVAAAHFSGVTHAFDEEDLEPEKNRLQYDERATIAAHSFLRLFLEGLQAY